jgi:nucleoside-diphosphate-sugar epimerase
VTGGDAVRTAVTGATGFIGRHLLRALRRRGWGATCLVRRKEAEADLRADGWDVVVGHLDDEDALRDLMASTDVVFHVAGLTAGSTHELTRVNVQGSQRVGRVAHRAAAARIVYVSCLAASGPSLRGQPLDKADRSAPVSAYGKSKADGEQAVMESGVPFTIVRPPAVYGPFDRELLRVFRWALKGSVPMIGDGGQQLSLVYAADLGEALVAAAERPATLNRVYHVAHSEVILQRELMRAIGTALGRRVNLFPLPAPLARVALELSGWASRLTGQRTMLSGDRAPELLAPAWTCLSREFDRDARWSAATGLTAGLAATATWYRESGWLYAKRIR